ncbi:hypothetical protein [Sphingomonas parva]|uniref:hypothetical protein n=1 Tax=Sphingomonas parva TaxID=2555898 RepID=UPI0014302E46|nr:hypothetical protein [Sphingomonas parva]
MQWQSIRLELEPSREFPRGSASRIYLLRLPLHDDGRIDDNALAVAPAQATVRRFWPNEPDLSGIVKASDDGWAFAFDEDGEILVRHRPHPIRLGESLVLTEPDGRERAFRVASLRALQ